MNDSLYCYIKGIIHDKTKEALAEFNKAVDCDLGEDEVKSTAIEYSRRTKMENDFEKFVKGVKIL